MAFAPIADEAIPKGEYKSAITDKYIDVELRARHVSAKNKPLIENE